MTDNKKFVTRIGRQSNIELARVISIMLIVLLHSTYVSFGYPTEIKDNILVLLFSSISIFGVDVFLLISGYFSIKPKKSSIFNILFICLFASFFRCIIDYFVKGEIDIRNIFFISRSNWFIVSYIGLLILSPILNSYIEKVTKKHLQILIIAFYIFSFYFSLFPKLADIEPGFNYGCSVLWFIEMYLIGRYLNKFGIPHVIRKYAFIFFVICVLFVFSGQIALIQLGLEKLSWFGAQNQPIVLLAALCFFTLFTKIDIKSGFVNRIAQSTLAVLLLHSPNMTKGYFNYINGEYNLLTAGFLWIVGVIVIYFVCTSVDQIRIFVYNKFILRFVDKKHHATNII